MNDKYFACTPRGSHTQLNRLEKDEHVPVFGERRSPSCVEDWLEINDFDCVPAPIDSPAKLKTRVKLPKNALNIQTRFLQRENSFGSSAGSSGTVKSIIEIFSKSNKVENESSGVNRRNRPSRSPFVSMPDKNNSSQKTAMGAVSENKSLLLAPRITSTVPKIHSSSIGIVPVTSPSVLASLKPARRKKRQAPRAEDIYTNSKEKQQIMQALSNIDIRSSDDNYDVVIDSFSLEGEFV